MENAEVDALSEVVDDEVIEEVKRGPNPRRAAVPPTFKEAWPTTGTAPPHKSRAKLRTMAERRRARDEAIKNGAALAAAHAVPASPYARPAKGKRVAKAKGKRKASEGTTIKFRRPAVQADGSVIYSHHAVVAASPAEIVRRLVAAGFDEAKGIVLSPAEDSTEGAFLFTRFSVLPDHAAKRKVLYAVGTPGEPKKRAPRAASTKAPVAGAQAETQTE